MNRMLFELQIQHLKDTTPEVIPTTVYQKYRDNNQFREKRIDKYTFNLEKEKLQ